MQSPLVGMRKGIRSGTLTATALVLALLSLLTSYHDMADEPLVTLLTLLSVAFSLLLVSGFLVASVCALVGIPIVWLLSRNQIDDKVTGGISGAVAGLAVFALPLIAGDSGIDQWAWAWIALAGASGGVTGIVWGRDRERQRAIRAPSPNRIHDPRILR